MTYPHTARAAQANAAIVPVLTGLASQHGHPFESPNWKVPDAIVEQAIVDAGYCLDATDAIPLGACYGTPCYEEFAAAIQMTERRP